MQKLSLHFFCMALLLAALLPCSHGQVHRDTRTPDKIPTAAEIKNPPKSWVDPDTGHLVVRLTKEPGSASFYFKGNAYTPDGKEMIYTTPEGISVLSLQTLQPRSVVKGKVHTIVVGHLTPSVFYIKPSENALYKTNVDTGETAMLAKVPPHGNIPTVNADETLAAGTYDEVDRPGEQFGHNGPGSSRPVQAQTSPIEQAASKGEMMVKRLAARIPLALYTLNLKDGKQSNPWKGDGPAAVLGVETVEPDVV